MLLGDSERWVIGFKYTGEVQPMYPTWDGASKPAYGSSNARIISSKAYLVDSSRYSVGIDKLLEEIKLEGHVSTADRVVTDASDYTATLQESSGAVLQSNEVEPISSLVAYNAVEQASFTGFDREKPLRGAYFGVDKTITIEQGEPYPLTLAALVTKTDLN